MQLIAQTTTKRKYRKHKNTKPTTNGEGVTPSSFAKTVDNKIVHL